jgi:hypothetical protein
LTFRIQSIKTSPMNTITDLSIQQLRQAASLKEQIASLEKQILELAGSPANVAAKPPLKATKKGGMSAEGRARVAAAQKARWARIKAGTKPVIKATPVAKPVPAPIAQPAKKKFTMSAAAKAKISAAAKARWAKVKSSAKPVAAKSAPAVKPAPIVKPALVTTSVPAAKPAKKKISAEGIARIKAAQKARWAKIKAAKK